MPAPFKPEDAEEVRTHLVGALHADLIGPFDPSPAGVHEVLRFAPSRWYLTGFIAPEGDNEPEKDSAVDNGDELSTVADKEHQDETEVSEPEPKRRKLYPSSLGLSVLMPPGMQQLMVTVSWADYTNSPGKVLADGKRVRDEWTRQPREPQVVRFALDAAKLRDGIEVPNSGGLELVGRLQDRARKAATDDLPDQTRALSLFLVNRRRAGAGSGQADRKEERYAFQVALELRCDAGFLPRPNPRSSAPLAEDTAAFDDGWDDSVADLQYRARRDYAVGHGVGVEAVEATHEGGAIVQVVRTTWLPTSEVRRAASRSEDKVVTEMDKLAQITEGPALRAALQHLPSAYASWIEAQSKAPVQGKRRGDTRRALVDRCKEANRRIEAGIDILAKDAQAREAFNLVNQAMAMSARQRSPERTDAPRWYLFQLAFVLLNVRAVTDPAHADRELVDLIFFPTGGGKTEAYLGVVTFTLLLRRLRGQGTPHGGLGVAVLLRYTLRLLTLDQLGRAATLICALEHLRREAPAKLGTSRFAIGLWVGQSATANTLEVARDQINQHKSGMRAASPFPLSACPWCRTPLKPACLNLEPARKPTRVVVGCAKFDCEFALGGDHPEGIPVVYVDEQVYHELPAFVVATVDKFAMLPLRGETAMLFGRVWGSDVGGFVGHHDTSSTKGKDKLPDGLLPPDLIIQDELHLISGPLGTMIGLYEAALEALASRTQDGQVIKPKIITSTATVRRAQRQAQALFARSRTELFPPAGIDVDDNFFSYTNKQDPGRLYTGVAAPGRAHKSILLRVYVALLSAAAKHATDPAADGYMTLAGYFNSLRELGGMRRLVDDEVFNLVKKRLERCPHGANAQLWFGRRRDLRETAELTSRVSTGEIAKVANHLKTSSTEDGSVDVLLASNMISVGVDIPRLGLMVVAGQPKTASEYIQASSRVGRDKWPGLVVTCYNLHKPRDRSYYEHFSAYHQSFYRYVEAASVTPFADRALDRGLAGVVVAMIRLLDPQLTPAQGVQRIGQRLDQAKQVIEGLAKRTAGCEPSGREATGWANKLTQRAHSLLDSWRAIVDGCAAQGYDDLTYSRFDADRTRHNLLTPSGEEPRPGGEAPQGTGVLQVKDHDMKKFFTYTSMRDVEPVTHLWVSK